MTHLRPPKTEPTTLNPELIKLLNDDGSTCKLGQCLHCADSELVVIFLVLSSTHNKPLLHDLPLLQSDPIDPF